MKKILLLGNSGKMGLGLSAVLPSSYHVIGVNSKDFDATKSSMVEQLIVQHKPDVVINCIAYLGIDPAEKNPVRACLLNTKLPYQLARLSNEYNFKLVHISSDAVFSDLKEGFHRESSTPDPQNTYGMTKWLGDEFCMRVSKQCYIVRVSLLFGPSVKHDQFVEKMLLRLKEGVDELSVSDDIIFSPCYTLDVAGGIKTILDDQLPFGLYHVANSGCTSLFYFMTNILFFSGLPVKVNSVSSDIFPSIGKKNKMTPITSEKLPALRHWKEAVKDYCNQPNPLLDALKEKYAETS